ncbi:BCCT family transporter [Oceanimonas sp. NS1]|nr:BCCT family transporter [Oceanimonas sp. NS1]
MFFLTNPEQAIKVAGDIFTLIAYNFGTPILWFAFGLVILAAFFVFSKYGHIRMGNEKPEFSTFSYIAMMALAEWARAPSIGPFWNGLIISRRPRLPLRPDR